MIRVLSVAEPVYPPPPPIENALFGVAPYQDASIMSVQERLLQQAQKVAADVVGTLDMPGVRAEAVAERGDPRDVIIEQARDFGADLVVLGSHGRTGLRRWILGSVAESVVRHAPCSVEVARARADQSTSVERA
jgi:nucleotide-binding universal stress UspA family protein